MVKVLVLLFGVAMFFGGFWRATSNQKNSEDMLNKADDAPIEPKVLSSEREETTELETDVSDNSEYIEPIVPKEAVSHKTAATVRTKTRRANKGKKVV